MPPNLATTMPATNPASKPLAISRNEFARRRKDLMACMEPNSIAILPGAKEVKRNADSHYPFRQDSDFYYLTGFPEPEAVAVLAEAQGAGDGTVVSALWMVHTLAVAGRCAEAERLLERTVHTAGGDVPGYHLALAHTGIGHLDLAIAALETAADQRDPALMQTAVDPRLRPLHGHPRFAVLLRRLNLPTSSTSGLSQALVGEQ